MGCTFCCVLFIGQMGASVCTTKTCDAGPVTRMMHACDACLVALCRPLLLGRSILPLCRGSGIVLHLHYPLVLLMLHTINVAFLTCMHRGMLNLLHRHTLLPVVHTHVAYAQPFLCAMHVCCSRELGWQSCGCITLAAMQCSAYACPLPRDESMLHDGACTLSYAALCTMNCFFCHH